MERAGAAWGAGPASAPLSRRIPSTGEAIPVVGLGTWQTFDVGSTPAERTPLEEVLGAFVELGGRLVDSSPMYGQSEEVVGDIAAKLALRPKLFIATKVWTSGAHHAHARTHRIARHIGERQILDIDHLEGRAVGAALDGAGRGDAARRCDDLVARHVVKDLVAFA